MFRMMFFSAAEWLILPVKIGRLRPFYFNVFNLRKHSQPGRRKTTKDLGATTKDLVFTKSCLIFRKSLPVFPLACLFAPTKSYVKRRKPPDRYNFLLFQDKDTTFFREIQIRDFSF